MPSFDEMVADELRRQRDILQGMNYLKAVREIDDTHHELLNPPKTTTPKTTTPTTMTSHDQPEQASVTELHRRPLPEQRRDCG